MMRYLDWCLMSCLFAAACDTSTNTVTALSELCVRQGEQENEVEIHVTFTECLSSSCDTVTSASCLATEANGQVIVDSEADIESKGRTCTGDCQLADATCVYAVSGPGSYTFVGGGRSVEYVHPGPEVCGE